MDMVENRLDIYISVLKEFKFKLRAGQVIKGMDQGLLEYSPRCLTGANNSMYVGETRKLVIPPDMAYGDRSMGAIKAGSTLGTNPLPMRVPPQCGEFPFINVKPEQFND
jgi:FKBP-type peptidyl-prolyl cis-trans isomerase 2